MRLELHDFLMKADVRGAWEYPPQADWAAAIARVRGLKPDLERIVSTQLHLDDQVQDASFFADLGSLSTGPTENGTILLSYRICVRFSWFADMFTVFGDKLSDFDLQAVKDFLEKHGYVYVPANELEQPYDGVNVPYEAELTWWTRYFDYL